MQPVTSNAGALLDRYHALLRTHDWFHEASDDGRRYREGREQRRELEALRKQIDPDYSVWNSVSPAACRNGRSGM